MFDQLWKKVDGLFDAVDHVFDDKKIKTHQIRHGYNITATDGHIVITGSYRTLTINGRRIRLPEEKK